MDKKYKNFNEFLKEGKREQDKIDELLDQMTKRKLTDEEKKLLTFLSKGGQLPQEEVKKETEFTTKRGQQQNVSEIEDEELLDARVYRDKDSDERFFYIYRGIKDIRIPIEIKKKKKKKEGDEDVPEIPLERTIRVNNWLIYRSTGNPQFPYGMFMGGEGIKKFYGYNPKTMWEELDTRKDYGMVLDKETLDEFMGFVDMYDAFLKKERVDKAALEKIYKKLKSLI